ncbi:hypothetical protein PCK1_002416 [Pneumocystis canis]|nr:hypothetical protein PCK1_002416 [Pneumocystis canis]
MNTSMLKNEKINILQIKRKRDEEPIPLLFMKKSASPDFICPFKRKKQDHDYLFMLSETLYTPSTTTYAEKQTESPLVYTLKQTSTNEQDKSTNSQEITSFNENGLPFNSNIHSFSSKDYVYDFTQMKPFQRLHNMEDEETLFPEVTLSSSEDNDDYEDSNAEDFYQNTYPDEDVWLNMVKSRRIEENRKKEQEQNPRGRRIKSTLEEGHYEPGSLEDYIYHDSQKGELTSDEYEMLNWRKRRQVERTRQEKNGNEKKKRVKLKIGMEHGPTSGYSTFLSVKSSSRTPHTEKPIFKPLHLFSSAARISQSSIRSTNDLEQKLSQQRSIYKRKNKETLHLSSQQKPTLLTLSSSTIPIQKRKVGRPRKVKFSPIKNYMKKTRLDMGIPSIYAETTTHTPFQQQLSSQDDPTKYNEDFCSACKRHGRFLCCESCPRSFHFSCIEPPIDEDNLPEDAWHCTLCRTKRYPPPKQPRGIFSFLMEYIIRNNPKEFCLPLSIREYFEGVSTGPDGEYQDSVEHRNQKCGRQKLMEERDPFQLEDKNGNPILCYKCSENAMDGKAIVSCDYCSLHWHIDCIDPPMSGVPAASRKWMCPNHAYHVTPKIRQPKKSKILDRGFKNNGNIEIDNTEEEQEELLKKHKNLSFDDSYIINNIRYRLPENGVKLDFLDKVRTRLRKSQSIQKSQINSNKIQTDSLESILPDTLGPLEREIIKDFVQLGLVEVTPQDHKNLTSLITIAQAELDAYENFGKNENSEKNNIKTEQKISDEEHAQVLTIKKLIKIKGYSALVEFLTTY